MTKKQKIWLVGSVGFLLLCGAILGVESFIQGQNAKTAALNEQIEASKNEIENLKINFGFEKIGAEADSLLKTNEINQLKTDLNKNQIQDVSSIVAEWKPSVVRVVCSWNYSNGQTKESSQGSGTVFPLAGGEPAIISNAHVITDSSGKYFPTVCDDFFPYGATGYYPLNSKFWISPNSLDLGVLYFANVDHFISLNTKSRSKVCTITPAVGDKIVVIGYPAIGDPTNITATEGIISGYDGDYYITSAKIDHGNSGGAAILEKDDCYIGIPTEVVAGSLESLGRILKSNLIFKN